MLTKLLAFIAVATTKYNRYVLVIAVLATIICGIFVSDLQINLSFLAIMPKDEEIQRFNKVVEDFGGSSDLLLVIEAHHPQDAKNFAAELSQKLMQIKQQESGLGIRSIDYKFDFEWLKDYGLLFVPEEPLSKIAQALVDNKYKLSDIYENLHLPVYLEKMQSHLRQSSLQMNLKATEPNPQELLYIIQAANTSLKIMENYVHHGKKVDEQSILNEIKSSFQPDIKKMIDLYLADGYIFSADNKMMLVSIRLNGDIIKMPFGFKFYRNILDTTEELVQDYPGIKASYTGMMATGYEDQTYTLIRFQWLSLISLILVILLFFFISKMYQGPILVAITLIMAMVWTFAMVKLFLGFVSLTSMVFVVLLFGLGIDFAIHLMVRINEEYTTKDISESGYGNSIQRAIRKTGRGIITGGFTTVLAFLSMCIANDKSAQHLGFTTGVGLFFCLIAMVIVFPAFLYLFFNRKQRIFMDHSKESHLLTFGVRYVIRYPRTVLALSIIFLCIFGYQIRHFYMEYNLEKIIHRNIPSLDAKKKVQQIFGQTNDFIMISTKTMEENRRLAKELQESNFFAQVLAISQFIPPQKSQKICQKEMAKIHQVLEFIHVRKVPQDSSPMSVLHVIRIVTILNQLQIQANLLQEFNFNNSLLSELTMLENRCRKLRKYIQNFENINNVRRNLGYFEYIHAQKIIEVLENLRHMSYPLDKDKHEKILSQHNLPLQIRDRFVSLDQKSLLILAYPKNASFSFENIHSIRKVLNEIVPGRAAGIHLITEKFITSGLKDFPVILVSVLFILIIILSLDFRSLKYLIFTCIPLFFSAVISMGIICSTGVTISVIMLSALPLVFGIGIDDGVHMIHRYRENYDIIDAIKHTGKAIFLTTVTTVVSFGILMFTNHNGLVGMGIVVAIGTSLCFVFSVTILPAILVLFDKPKNT